MSGVTFHSFTGGQAGSNTITNLPISNMAAADIRVALLDATLSPAAATDVYWDDISANEVSGTNYTAGGAVLQNKTFSLIGGYWVLDADDVPFAQHASGFNNARYAIIRLHNATPGAAPLITYYDLGALKGNVAAALTIEWPTTGILRWPA